MNYIEDYLQHICENHLSSLNNIDAIYFSIYKQTVRGIGLTDRQYNLVKNKIKEYVSIDDNIECRIPLRVIDRSKYIKIVDTNEVYENTVYESYKSNFKWIKIRFPFSKKNIVKIDALKFKIGSKFYVHQKGSHVHYFKLENDNLHQIVESFANFDLDKEVVDIYNQQKEIKNSMFDYVPYLSRDNKLENLDLDAESNFLKNIDNSIRYGYFVPQHNTPVTLTEKIAYRNNQLMYIDPDEYTIEDILQSLNILERYPIVVLVDNDNPFEQIQSVHAALENVDNSEQSVLFRVDSSDTKNIQLNQYIKDNNLNNWVDENTKVVYIKKTKLPKILLKANFKPKCALSLTSIRSHKTVSTFCVFNCDCYIMLDNMQNMFFRGFNLANLQTYN